LDVSRVLLSGLAALPTLIGTLCSASAFAQTQVDPLPSWNDGTSKRVIIDFVARVMQQGGPDFVSAVERIAAFDNDGILWVEHPIYVQLAFALDRVKAMAPSHPEWNERQPFRAALEGLQSIEG
jgi:hypothetical protein